MKIRVDIPENIRDQIWIGNVYENIGANGRISSFGVDLVLYELNRRKQLKSRTPEALASKIEETLAQWSEMYQRHVEKLQRESKADRCDQEADQRNQEAKQTIDALSTILKDAQKVDHCVNWDRLKSSAPTVRDVKRQFGLLKRLMRPQLVRERFAEMERLHRQHNASIDDLRQRLFAGEPSAVQEHIDMVFQASQYPDLIPRNWESEFRPENGILVVNMELPELCDLPEVEGYTYNKTRNEIKQKKLPLRRRQQIYDDVIYQIIIRVLHEIFESDASNLIEMATVNGYIDTIHEATGKEIVKTIASVSVTKQAFQEINLSNVNPQATFKHFKGVAAVKLADMVSVAPLMQMDRTDKRFIESKDVASELASDTNIAAMSWQDFEYLIRELFHAEFSKNEGEVKVTQASADGGVDAIAFDPDPIRGGKIVIQAKRYTNTVGVNAVRELYGTVINEGASSGIMVTTSDYGRDAYNFAKDKPLKLLNGSNLLHLLERHGHAARIDLKEAKKLSQANR